MNSPVASRHLFNCAMQALNDLSIRSYRGDDEAARYLEDAVRHSVRIFEHLLWRPSGELRQRMAKAVDIPGLISLERDRINSNKLLATRIGLGTASGRNFQGKQATRRTGPTAAVIRMYQELTEPDTFISHLPIQFPYLVKGTRIKSCGAVQDRRHKSWRTAQRLLLLSRETHPAWCKAAWPLFYATYGTNFEEHPLFKKERDRVATSLEKKYRHDPKPPSAAALAAQERWEARNLIKKSVKQAWESIAQMEVQA